MMKIAIEAQRIFRTNKHGMDFVALEAIRCLQKIDKDNEYFIFVADGEDRCLEESPNMHIVSLHCPSYPLWEQWALPRAVKKVGADLLHCTSNTAPIFGKVPLVVTLHDIIFLEKQSGRNPSLYQALGRIYRRFVVPKILPKCKKIITVSNFERQRILSSLGLDPEKVVAIYNGYDLQFHPMEDYKSVVSKYYEDGHYIFFLGNTDPKKNTAGTLKAYSEYVKKSNNPATLLLADIDTQAVKIMLKEIGEEEIFSKIKFSGYIPNKDLPAIYNGATAFLYTSFRESFGIPILEAMACGTPVVTSNTSAIPEVAGDGAILVDPTNPSAIASALLRLEEDETFRKSSIEYSLERVKHFSWESTAKNMLDLYETITVN